MGAVAVEVVEMTEVRVVKLFAWAVCGVLFCGEWNGHQTIFVQDPPSGLAFWDASYGCFRSLTCCRMIMYQCEVFALRIV